MLRTYRHSIIYLSTVIILAISIVFPSYAYGEVPQLENKFDAYSVIKELSDTKYKGRVPGTPQYEQAAAYVKDEFKKWGVSPFGGEYFMSYKTNLATYVEQPSMSMDGKSLTVMEDFKPHGNSGNGNLKGNSVIFAGRGYPEDIESLNLTDQIVLMDANIKPEAGLGVADRISLIKKKGAKAVLLLPTQYYPIESYERPLNGNDIGLISLYIRKDLFDTSNLKIGDKLSKRLEIHVNINRKASVEAQNITGFVPGKDPHRTLIISATLDGLGYIPNSTIFNAASMNASGVAAVLSMAKYYKDHQPSVNILFAVIGSETTNRDGVNALINQYPSFSGARIIGFLNLYDLGGSKQNQKLYGTATDNSPLAAYLKKSPNMAYTDNAVKELYNFNNTVFESKGIPNAFFRGADSVNAVQDTVQKINVMALDKHIRTIEDIIDQFIDDPNYALYVKPSTVQPDDQGKVYVPEVNHQMSYFSTKYFDVFYEADRWENSEGLARKIDRVYEKIAWWNYFPQNNERIKVYYTNSYKDNWATAHRTPEPQNINSGGLQSPENYSISIIYLPNVKQDLADSLGTIYHELNHNLATYKLKELGYGNRYATEVQEIQGHADNYETQEVGYNFLRFSLKEILQKPLSSIRWDRYVTELEPGKELDTTYNQSASLIFYVYSKYSEDKGREFAYRMYTEDNKPLDRIVFETLNVSFDDFIAGWYDWFNGREVKTPSFKKDSYSPPKNDISVSDTKGTSSDKTLTTIKGNIAQGRPVSKDLQITSITAAMNGSNAIFSISYSSKEKRSFLLFDPPNGSKLSVRDVIKTGKNTLKVKVPISELRSVDKLTMNIYDSSSNNFLIINMDELWETLK